MTDRPTNQPTDRHENIKKSVKFRGQYTNEFQVEKKSTRKKVSAEIDLIGLLLIKKIIFWQESLTKTLGFKSFYQHIMCCVQHKIAYTLYDFYDLAFLPLFMYMFEY